MKDVILKADGAKFYFRFLEWDTNFFKKKSYMLDTEKSILKPSARITRLLNCNFADSFLSAKIDARTHKEIFVFFQQAGFTFIDTEIILTFDREHPTLRIKKQGVKVLRLKQNQGLPYEELGGVFTCSRFHSDTHISKAKADLLWVYYLKNYELSATHQLYAALAENNEVMGVILANLKKEGRTAYLFFVAVRDKFQGRRIGSCIVEHVIRSLGDYKLVTGTQAKNIRALNFYIKNGFSRVESTKLIFHRWGKH